MTTPEQPVKVCVTCDGKGFVTGQREGNRCPTCHGYTALGGSPTVRRILAVAP